MMQRYEAHWPVVDLFLCIGGDFAYLPTTLQLDDVEPRHSDNDSFVGRQAQD